MRILRLVTEADLSEESLKDALRKLNEVDKASGLYILLCCVEEQFTATKLEKTIEGLAKISSTAALKEWGATQVRAVPVYTWSKYTWGLLGKGCFIYGSLGE